MDRINPVYRFGPYTLDAARFELSRQGIRVRASRSQLELLLLFASRPGELVTRDQIVAALWSEPEMVDVRQGINTAVARLRGVLNDDPSKPRYVETVVGKGYRFVAAVQRVAPTLSPSAEVSPTAHDANNGLDVVAEVKFTSLLKPVEASAASRTALAEAERVQPDPFGSVPLAVNTVPPPQREATWSKGSTRVIVPGVLLLLAFAVGLGIHGTHKAEPAGQVPNEIPASAHKQITTNDPENPVSVAAISPDGTLLAYIDPGGIFLREMATGRTKLILGPKLRATCLRWFPDQTRLLLTGVPPEADRSEVWTLSSAGAAATLFRRDAGDGAPAPDGRVIAFTTDNGQGIRVASPDGTSERAVTKVREGEQLGKLFWSANGRRISFEQRSAGEHPGSELEFNYVWSYHSIEVATGHETASFSDISFDSAGETSNGTLYYLRAHPPVDRTHNGMWEVKTDRLTGAFLDKPKRLTAFGPYEVWTGMSVSGSGQITAIKEQWQQNIYYGELRASNRKLTDVTRVTTSAATDCPHSWSPDGKVIYFESDRVGSTYHLFRQAIDSPNAEMLTVGDSPQFYPVLLPDGNTLLYEDWRHVEEGYAHDLYRAQPDGSRPKLVLHEDELDQWRCATSPAGGCVLRKTEGKRSFAFYALDPASGSGKELAYTVWQPSLPGDWALSPDGKTAAIPNHEPGAPTIRLLWLDGSGKETVIKVHRSGQLWGVHWAQNGRGFFAQKKSGLSSQMQFINLDGQVSVLKDTTGNTWGVPTEDGTKLALVDSTENRNVFLWR